MNSPVLLAVEVAIAGDSSEPPRVNVGDDHVVCGVHLSVHLLHIPGRVLTSIVIL